MRPHSLVFFRITGHDGLYTVEWLPMFLVNSSALGATECHRVPKVDCLRIFRNTVLLLRVLEGGTPLSHIPGMKIKDAEVCPTYRMFPTPF